MDRLKGGRRRGRPSHVRVASALSFARRLHCDELGGGCTGAPADTSNEWTVREAGDGKEALGRVREARPRVVLLDLSMPVMDDFSFLDWLH